MYLRMIFKVVIFVCEEFDSLTALSMSVFLTSRNSTDDSSHEEVLAVNCDFDYK